MVCLGDITDGRVVLQPYAMIISLMWGVAKYDNVADMYLDQIVTRDRLRAASLVMGRIAQE